MKKEEFKAALDLIEPDAYLETRLKAKLNYERKSTMKMKKIFAGLIAAAVIIAAALGVYFPLKSHKTETTTPSSAVSSSEKNGNVNPFIMVAGAIDDEEALKNSTAFKTLNFNESFPYGYKISFESAKGMSEEEKNAAVEKKNDKLFHMIENNSEKYDCGTGMAFAKGNLIFTAVTHNNFKLKLENLEDVESVTVKVSSGWGQMNYYVDKFIHSENLAFLKGDEITVKTSGTGLDYDETARFKWKCSDKMLEAIAENPDIKISTFSDTITFTVLHKDKTKEVGVVDVTFDDDGNATFTNRGYSFYEN